jgi:hypothetical protein
VADELTTTPTRDLRTETLKAGDRVRFESPSKAALRWWDVRAADDRWAVLTQQAPFRPKGELVYTIVDSENGRRGPCNLIGQGWDVEEPGGCDALLAALQSGEVEISHRNNVETRIREVVRR